MKARHRPLPSLALALATLALAACSDAPPEAAPPAPPAAAPDLGARVHFAPLAAAREVTLASLPGEVTLPAGAVQALAPPVGGRLLTWAVALGARVSAGDALATFESPDLRDLEAQARELARVADARQRLVARERAQLAQGLVGAPALYEHELAAQEASARLEAVRAQLASRTALGADAGASWTWRAPGPGTVSAIACAAGTMTTPETPCLTLLAMADAELRVHVPERLLGLVGPDVRVVWHPASDPAARVDLHLHRVEPTLDPLSRTRAHAFGPTAAAAGPSGPAAPTAPAEPTEPAGAAAPPEAPAAPISPAAAGLSPFFVPGASGRADLIAPAPPGLLTVPEGALTRLGGRDVVFLAPPDGAAPTDATAVPVERVGRHADGVLVRSATLRPGARIAVRGAFLLKSLHALREGGGEAE